LSIIISWLASSNTAWFTRSVGSYWVSGNAGIKATGLENYNLCPIYMIFTQPDKMWIIIYIICMYEIEQSDAFVVWLQSSNK
jgi:hypothetical protein